MVVGAVEEAEAAAAAADTASEERLLDKARLISLKFIHMFMV